MARGSRLRLAIVSPLPPASTGIADYTIDVAGALGRDHVLELFHDQDEAGETTAAPTFRINELPLRAAAAPHDAVIYQVGNAPAHDFMYDWMERVPGVVVLHDLVLHHSYARRFLESAEARAYAADPSNAGKRARAEARHRAYREAIEVVHPGLGERLQEAHLNSVGDLLPYAYPLFEPALSGARAAGAHNSFMVEAIRKALPELPCRPLVMPMHPAPVSPEKIQGLRRRLGLVEADFVVGCFGLITREKRIETVARAVARVAEIHPGVRFLLAGAAADSSWLDSLLDRIGVRGRTVIAGRLPDDEFLAAMSLTDAVVQLRYPTARETSAALLRVMAQARPAIIADIANQSGIPADAVLRVDLIDEEGGVARALHRILSDPQQAKDMGERARRFVMTEHSAARTAASYDRLLASLAAR